MRRVRSTWRRPRGLLRRARRREWERKWQRTEKPGWFVEDARPQVREAVADGWIPKGSSVVELGCGFGHTAAWLATQGCTVLALDLSQRAVDEARRLHGDIAGVEFRQADVSGALPGVRPHDVVVDMACFHGFPSSIRAAYGETVKALTRPGSHLIYFMRAIKDAKSIDELVARLADALGPDFEVVRVLPEQRPAGQQAQRPAVEVRLVRR